MDKFKEIRPVVLGIIIKNNKLLVERGYDENNKTEFYRCIGGGIEFLEKSDEALKREFKEELNIEIQVKDYLGLSENIFKYKGKDAHELILFYNIEINDKDYKEKYIINDDGQQSVATWIDINKFRNKELIVYPEKVIDYIS